MSSVSVLRPELSKMTRAASLFLCYVFSAAMWRLSRDKSYINDHHLAWNLHTSTDRFNPSIMIFRFRQILDLFYTSSYIDNKKKTRYKCWIWINLPVWCRLRSAGSDWLVCYWMTKDTLNLNLVKQTCEVSWKHLWLMNYVTAPQISIRPRFSAQSRESICWHLFSGVILLLIISHSGHASKMADWGLGRVCCIFKDGEICDWDES